MAEVSRIGRKPINIPSNVKVHLKEDGIIEVEGPKGKLQKRLPPLIKINIEDNTLRVVQEEVRKKLKKKAKAFQGLARSLINNMIVGVTEGFKKSLDIIGLGYKAELKGDELILSLGYSHPINFKIPEGISIKLEKGAGDVQARIIVEGIDKELVGQTAANIKKFRPPEPYKGKGIRYTGEVIYRKAGKTGRGAK